MYARPNPEIKDVTDKISINEDDCPVCLGVGHWRPWDGRATRFGEFKCIACKGTGIRPDWLRK